MSGVTLHRPRCTISIGEYDLTPYLGDGATVTTHKDLYAPVGKWQINLPDKPYRATEDMSAGSGTDEPADQGDSEWGGKYKGATQTSGGSGYEFGDDGRMIIDVDGGTTASSDTSTNKTTKAGEIVDSFYGLIKPFDYCEIRMTRAAHEYGGKDLPIIMRGFVRSVTRDESMSGDGPQRTIVISGDDYGCFGEIIGINALAAATIYQSALAAMYPTTFGIDPNSVTSRPGAAEVQQTLLDDFINKQIGALEGETKDERITEIQFDGKVTVGGIDWNTFQSQQGTVWSVMMGFADTPWNELFIEDREDGPWLVYRPTPWRDYKTGELIPNMNQEINPDDIAVVNTPAGELQGEGTTSEQVFDLVRHASYTRTDQQVYNIFWVDIATPLLDTNKSLSIALNDPEGIPWCNQTKWKNSKSAVYGPRVLQIASRQMPGDVEVVPHTAHADQLDDQRMTFVDWQEMRREWLCRANRDNVMFDQGALSLRGNEKVKVGCYLNAERGAFWATHYVTQVTHSYSFPGGYSTSVNFIRGTNWQNRQVDQDAGLSPFLREGRKGLYTQSSFGGMSGLAGMAIGAVMSDGGAGALGGDKSASDGASTSDAVSTTEITLGSTTNINGERWIYAGVQDGLRVFLLAETTKQSWGIAAGAGDLIDPATAIAAGVALVQAGAMPTAKTNGLPVGSWLWTSTNATAVSLGLSGSPTVDEKDSDSALGALRVKFVEA